ncbi:MAG TPA: DUF4197 domain-containing protein [Bacteroidia bacterium]|jgi:hypothetical protein|nr:DUF4197 domain-containing protein [Bacteroidia bacterium]
MKKIILPAALAFMLFGCTDLGKTLNDVNTAVQNSTGTTVPLTNADIVQGLKDALSQGATNGSNKASAVDGFNANPRIHIPFPPAAQKVADFVISIGMQSQVDKFVLTLNRAAEDACKGAAPIFIDAIKSMTVSDGLTILKGSDTAATHFLRDKCAIALGVKFKPTVQQSTQKVKLTEYWTPLTTAYNKIPTHTAVQTDLDQYVTDLAVSGIFKLVGDEETSIRTNPAARATDIMKKVFGSKDNPHNQ